ncbi:acetyl-CoA acetyltransferase [Gammaproteobacteria bacterium 42_54_T18]|nr:acetyl-CoA acetyltransferase [Gammaproteobacteria bacterium 42_54_T18]
MTTKRIYILGGYQSDFKKNWTRDGQSLFELFSDTVKKGITAARIEPKDIEVGHVSNFVGDLFSNQAHLGGFFGHVDPELTYLPASRHEAACASGSMALLAAMADLESERYDLACVLGIELMRNVTGKQAAEYLRPAAWADKEWSDTPYVWPCAFDQLIQQYDTRYGINHNHLNAIAEKNYLNARNNPNAQTRNWTFNENSFTANETENPTVIGSIRRQDCGQISDGAAVVFLANEKRANAYAKERNISLDDIPYIKGWGHINAPMLFSEKINLSSSNSLLFPHIHKLFKQTLARANINSLDSIQGLEVHDCFTITEYMTLDHLGLYPPGQAWKAIEAGVTAPSGKLPINMSGGLIGGGHPVGATGVRMALDAYKQVTGNAGDYQIDNAKNIMTFNLGGSTTTCASLIIGKSTDLH